MDKGANTTQNIVISVAVILGVIIVLTIVYSLYQKAKAAEAELANKTALDRNTARANSTSGISLTNESQNSSLFNYDGLVQKGEDEPATTSNFEVVNETIPEEVISQEIIPVETTPEPEPASAPIIKQAAKPVVRTAVIVDEDRPLTLEEIRQIRQLPIENSPSGKLQTTLEEYSKGEYRAKY